MKISPETNDNGIEEIRDATEKMEIRDAIEEMEIRDAIQDAPLDSAKPPKSFPASQLRPRPPASAAPELPSKRPQLAPNSYSNERKISPETNDNDIEEIRDATEEMEIRDAIEDAPLDSAKPPKSFPASQLRPRPPACAAPDLPSKRPQLAPNSYSCEMKISPETNDNGIEEIRDAIEEMKIRDANKGMEIRDASEEGSQTSEILERAWLY